MKLKGNQLSLTSSRLQNYINGDLMREDIKYRIILIDDVNQLLVNTRCTRTANTFSSDTSSNFNSTTHRTDALVKPPHQHVTFVKKPTNHTSNSTNTSVVYADEGRRKTKTSIRKISIFV